MSSNGEAKQKNNREIMSYAFGFANADGITYGYHMSDDLQDHVTWESVEFKFSMPDSQYLLIWRRDNKKMTDEESQRLVGYVKEDMEDFTSEGTQSGPGTQTKILHMLLPSRDYLVMAYDELALPDMCESWEEFAYSIFDEVCGRSEKAADQGGGHNEKIEDVLSGNVFYNPEKDR